MVLYTLHSCLSRAVSTAIEFLIRLDAVTDDSASTVLTMRCQPLDGTFEAIECEPLVIHDYIEGQVILVPTNFTASHDVPLAK